MTLGRRLQLHSLAVVVLTVVAVAVLDPNAGWVSLFLPAVVGAAAGILLAVFSARSVTRTINELRTVTRSLATGNLLSRPPLAASGELGDLSTAIYRLAEQLGLRMSTLQAEDALLTALIESLHEGVVAISPDKEAVRINRAAREILGASDRIPFPVDYLPRIPALRRAVQSALEGTATEPTELMIGAHVASVTARPLADGGAVLALFDLTRMRQLEIVRRDFVANVSHELRTPLTVIGGFAETLADENVPESTRRQFASTIRSHTERMQRIVDDLLDLSRLESGRWGPQVETIDIRAVASEVLGGVRATAEARGITLELSIGDSAAEVNADRTALRQILSNLVENAIRHTTNGSVSLFSTREGDGVWIGVHDTGRGIPPEHLPRIFERFYRVDAGRDRESGGTGLGLAIVKHLVEAHGGRVNAKSELGRGTRIAVFLPDGGIADRPLPFIVAS